MAVSVNKVYQTVLRLCNKEKRGFLTPKEFNLFAETAQMDIFEQYFFDLNQFRRLPGNETLHADPRDVIEDKIAMFKQWSDSPNATPVDNFGNINLTNSLGSTFYRLTGVRVRYNPSTNPDFILAEEIDGDTDYWIYGNSKKASFNKNRPIFIKYYQGQPRIKIRPFPDPINDLIRLNWLRKPSKPKWTYVIHQDKPYYNPAAADHNDFELHYSEESNLVNKILMMAGVTIDNQALAQSANAQDNKSIQQEKI